MSLLQEIDPWSDPENQIDPKIKPFAQTHDYKIHGGHQFDTICYLAGLPLYSHDSGVVRMPTWNSFTAFLKKHLEISHGSGGAGSSYYELGAFNVRGVIPSLLEIRRTISATKIKDLHPDDGIIHKGQVYVKIQPAHLLRVHDPGQSLGQDGPVVLMRGGKDYVTLVSMGYDPVSQCWMPFLRENQHCYLSEKMDCHLLELNVNSKREEVTPLFDEEAVATYGDMTAHEFKMEHYGKTLMVKGQKLTKVITKSKMMDRQTQKKLLRVFFDLETFYRLPDAAPVDGVGGNMGAGGLVPYSLVYMALDEDEFIDQAYEPWDTEKLKDRAKIIKGFDSAQVFVDYLVEQVLTRKYAEIKLSAYNGSGFDFFFILQAIEKRSALRDAMQEEDEWWSSNGPDIYWTNQFFTNGRLLSGEIRVRDEDGEIISTRITLFDISKHMIGMSLAGCCKAFKTPHKKIDGFSHDHVMDLYLKNSSNFFNEPEFAAQLEEYNIYDVITLMELETAYIREMSKLVDFVDFHTPLPLTIGSLAYKVLTNDWKNRNLPIDRLDLGVAMDWSPENLTVEGLWQPIDVYMYESWKTGIPGGISNVVNGPQIVEEPVSSPDVKGLYSYIECIYPCWFPVGPYVKLEVGERPRDPEKILGIYHIDVDMRPLMEKDLHLVLPLKFFTRSGSLLRNNWNETEVNDTWVTTPILKLLLLHECPITWRGGYEWGGRIRSCDLFEVFLPFIQEKNRQDKLKNANDPQYNPALRTVCKGMPNCGYGQSIAGVFPRSVTSMNAWALEKLYENPKVDKVNVIKVIDGRAYADVTYTLASRIHKQHPLAMGCFILGYSQEYMFKQILHRIPRSVLLYIDTDSCKVPTRVYHELKERFPDEKVPHWPDIEDWVPDYKECPLWEGWEGGAFEDELPANGGAVIVAKKTYVIMNEAQDGPCLENGKAVMSCKGVRKDDVPVGNQSYHDLISLGDDYEAYLLAAKKYYHTLPKITEVGHLFFKSILAFGSGYVLSSSLLRSLTNLRTGVTADNPEQWNHSMGQLAQSYRLKKISIQDGGIGSRIPYVLGQPLAAGAPELIELGKGEQEDLGEDDYDEDQIFTHVDDDVPEFQFVFGDEEDEFN